MKIIWYTFPKQSLWSRLYTSLFWVRLNTWINLMVSGFMELVKVKKCVMVRAWWRVEMAPIVQSIRSLRLWPPWVLEFMSEICMFDIVSTIPLPPQWWCSYRAVMNTSIVLAWGVILSDKNIFIVDVFSSYNFNGVPIGYHIALQKFIIHLWSNKPKYIYLVAALELIPDILGCFLKHQPMMVPLKRWDVEVTDSLSLRYLEWSVSQSVWKKLKCYYVWFISELSDLKKHWSGLSFVLKVSVLEYIMGSYLWCMRYSMPCLRDINCGYVGALIYPLKSMVRYRISYHVLTVMFMIPQTQWFSDPPWYFPIFLKSSPISGVARKR